MDVKLQIQWSDRAVDSTQIQTQRQLAISLSAMSEAGGRSAPLNLCLILDHSGSMNGKPLANVRDAAQQLVEQLQPGDRITVIAFDHRAKVLVPNQALIDSGWVKDQIRELRADGGTAIDEGMRLGIEEMAKGRLGTVSQAFLLTDGENEHGSNDRCLKMAGLAASHNMTLHTFGVGDHWNQDVLEQIADAAGGSLSYIPEPEAAVASFRQLFERIQSVTLTNAYLRLNLNPLAKLAAFKPIAQVLPETVELELQPDGDWQAVRLGDLMADDPRVVLVNLYLANLAEGEHTLGRVQVRYDHPAQGKANLLSEAIPISLISKANFQANPDPEVQRHILTLAKYRQTQIAETKLQQGDRQGAVTLLQSAARTALQMGDQNAATVLQENATRLQSGEELSERDRKQTRIVSKTVLQ